jgi:hypothetical protein
LSAQAQRNVNVSKEELIVKIREDIQFWKKWSSEYLVKSKQSIVRLEKIEDNQWVQTSGSASKFEDVICDKISLAVVDSLTGMVSGTVFKLSFPEVSHIAFSTDSALKNKIGFGFKKYDQEGNYLTDYIYFVDYDFCPQLKDVRRTNFLKLLSVIKEYPKADSSIHISVNTRSLQLHLFDFSKIYYSDSIPSLIPLADALFRHYEKDFAPIYYSGKDSSYFSKEDQWGNTQMRPVVANEYLVDVYDANGSVQSERAVPYSMNPKAISLYFDKVPATSPKRLVYPGIYMTVFSSSAILLGEMDFYLSYRVVKRFSQTSQTLFDYLTQIYN